MTKTLIIVESPSKAKSIKSVLKDDYIVQASMGHIYELPAKGLNVDTKGDFRPQTKLMDEKKALVNSLAVQAKNVDLILLASDPDREGEAIAFNLLECLKNSGKPIKRVEFHEITPAGIKKGISSARELDFNLYEAQQARRSLDRIVGYMASPILGEKLGDKHLSAGRVQSIALRMIVDREVEIEEFKPEEYWNIFATLVLPANAKEKFQAKLSEKINNKPRAEIVKKELNDSSGFMVIKVDGKPRKRLPNPPFSTPGLIKAAANKFHFQADVTMKIAQRLYEGKSITYMRTDSLRASPESIQEARQYLKENKFPIPTKPNQYKGKEGAQDAHECIRPTVPGTKPEDLFGSDDEIKLYGLIWDRFIASQMNPAVYDSSIVTIQSLGDGGHLLEARGSILKELGWLALSGDSEKETNKDVSLPILKVGDTLTLVPPKIKADQLFTKPPSRFNEGSLIEEMEKKEIGRPSTYATITSKIKEKKYVTQANSTYTPTDLGRKICKILTGSFSFMELKYTADMEAKLDLMAAGKLKFLPMMQEFFNNFSNELKKQVTVSGIVCYICKGQTQKKTGPYGEYLKCIEPNCGKNSKIFDNNKK